VELPQFVADFTKATRISAELGQWSLLAETVREWKATAAVYADQVSSASSPAPLSDDHGPVQGPMGADRDRGKRGDRVAPPGRPGGREARFNTWEAWTVLTERPAAPETRRDGDPDRRLVWVVAAGPSHPKSTE
jgi:hypothetical protein